MRRLPEIVREPEAAFHTVSEKSLFAGRTETVFSAGGGQFIEFFVADFFEIRFIGKREFSLGNFIAGVNGIAFFACRIGVQQNDHNLAAVISVDNAADGDNAMIGRCGR